MLSQEDFEEANIVQPCSTIQKMMRGWQHGDEFVRLSDDEGLKHVDKLLKSKYTAKVVETLGFEDSDATGPVLLNRVFRVGTEDNTWTMILT